MSSTIKILVVDDSKLVRDILKDIFAADPEFQVVGEAVNGKEAVQMTRDLKPDLITMDIQMPVMDGFEATEQIMAYTPTPILIFSSAIDKSEQYTSFKAISLGALDNMSKPDITQEGFEQIAGVLRRKVRMLSHINVIPHIRGKFKVRSADPTPGTASTAKDTAAVRDFPIHMKYQLVAIGSSTGGPMALQKILSVMPSRFPVGIVCVQHISKGFINSFVEWLGTQTPLTVKIAQNNEEIRPGTVYFAPDDAHLTVTADKTLLLEQYLPPWGEFKPSVNHLFQSVGQKLRDRAIGVILTGMGSDGAEGMKVMADNGAYTIAQNRDTSLIFGMPKASIDNKSARCIKPLDKIAEEIIDKIKEKI